jgi:hypothetical protein
MRTIVWDVDDVLNDLMYCWFERVWKPQHREAEIDYMEITQNPPHQVLGMSHTEYINSLDSLRLSEKAKMMKPNSLILEWLKEYGSTYRHLALTARPLDSVPILADWLFKNFGGFIRTFTFVPIRLDPNFPNYDTSKKEFLQWLNKADIFIDDNEDNVNSANSIGIRGILYPQPWNSCRQTPREILNWLANY